MFQQAGTRTDPSTCWWVSRIATMARVIAHSVPLRVAIGFTPSANRPRVSRRRVWNSVQFEVEVTDSFERDVSSRNPNWKLVATQAPA